MRIKLIRSSLLRSMYVYLCTYMAHADSLLRTCTWDDEGFCVFIESLYDYTFIRRCHLKWSVSSQTHCKAVKPHCSVTGTKWVTDWASDAAQGSQSGHFGHSDLRQLKTNKNWCFSCQLTKANACSRNVLTNLFNTVLHCLFTQQPICFRVCTSTVQYNCTQLAQCNTPHALQNIFLIMNVCAYSDCARHAAFYHV